jgi:arylsulfatase A-like enzyme
VTGHPYVKTPNIDKLAAEGIQFENGYMSGAWCAPSRYAIMSSCFPAHYFNETREMDTEAANIYRVLNSAGYATAHFGKWHVSGRQQDDPHVSTYGMDEHFIANGNGNGWTPAERNQPHWREHTTQKYVDLTIDFIERNHAADKPVFVNLSVYPPHSYINPTAEMLEPYKNLQVNISDFENPLQREFLEWISEQGDLQNAMRSFCADITELDNHVGRLMQTIKNLDIEREPMVIFTSDHGPAPLGAVDNLDGLAKRMKERPNLINNVGSPGPFRDRKISLHDGGIHVPLFVWWPGKITAGATDTETIFTGVDILPTLAALTGAEILAGIDGENLLQALGGTLVARSKIHFWNDRPGWTAVRDCQWKAHLRRGTVQLFHILEDPSESNDLANEYPEIAQHYLQLMEEFENSVLK